MLKESKGNLQSTDSNQGVAFLCDWDGRIQKVIRDELGVARQIAATSRFEDFVDSANAAKATRFLETLRTRHVAFGWEMHVPLNDIPTPLHFVGIIANDQMFIVAARTRAGTGRFHEALVAVNNEQGNALRAISKELALFQSRADRDNQLFDELSRLNNELATVQRELMKKNAELKRLDEEKNQILGMVAHDLRNPLGVILNNSELFSELLDSEDTPILKEDQREFVAIIKASTEFLRSMINDLVDISAIDSGKLHLELRPVNVAQLVRRIVDLNRPLADKKQIEVEVSANAELPEPLWDAGKLRQVLNNLLSNAIKFSYPGTRVEVRMHLDGDNIVLSVKDQGQGIPTGELEKLFKPFQNISVKSTAGEHSTGLGLAIVHKIISAHGGRVWAESKVSQGSTFSVSLPAFPATVAEV